MMDILERLTRYRQVEPLPDGTHLLLRPLAQGDKQGLLDLFARASRQDLEYFRNDAADPSVVEGWVDSLDLSKIFPLVAIVEGRIVGDATLHFGQHYQRHGAWVRIYLDHDYRGHGIGMMMIASLIKVARFAGLKRLYAEVLTLQNRVIQAFEDLGFRHEVSLPDRFMTEGGQMLDMAILVMRLEDKSGEF